MTNILVSRVFSPIHKLLTLYMQVAKTLHFILTTVAPDPYLSLSGKNKLFSNAEAGVITQPSIKVKAS